MSCVLPWGDQVSICYVPCDPRALFFSSHIQWYPHPPPSYERILCAASRVFPPAYEHAFDGVPGRGDECFGRDQRGQVVRLAECVGGGCVRERRTPSFAVQVSVPLCRCRLVTTDCSCTKMISKRCCRCSTRACLSKIIHCHYYLSIHTKYIQF